MRQADLQLNTLTGDPQDCAQSYDQRKLNGIQAWPCVLTGALPVSPGKHC